MQEAWEAVCHAHEALDTATHLVAVQQTEGPLSGNSLGILFIVLLKAQRKALEDLAGVYKHGNYTCF